jgi:hypothetical protein
MLNSRNLGFHLHRIAWSVVNAEMPRGEVEPADPWDDDCEASAERRRVGSLELLYVYTRMIKVLQRRVDWTVNEALASGASYGDIAAVCGITRQAARQRWLRRRQQRSVRTMLPVRGLPAVDWDGVWRGGPHAHATVRLVGGPCDGQYGTAKPDQDVRIEVPQSHGSDVRQPQVALYVPTGDDPTVYAFARLTKARPQSEAQSRAPMPEPFELAKFEEATGDGSARKPRVWELAEELHLESKDVMIKLMEMGEFVRSASSTIAPPIARRLREAFFARRDGHDKDSETPNAACEQ